MTKHSGRRVMFLAVAAFVAQSLAAENLPSDPRVQTGKLENGLKWFYRQHANPPGKMAILVHVATGSLNESDGQRGLAHFLEHMAFNGTENFPPESLIPYFESIGMEFGPDANAFTSFDQTVYMLMLPDAKPEQVEGGLKVLSDFVFRMSLRPDEVEKERGVILAEQRAGKSAQQRMQDDLFPRLFAGSRFGQRMVLGKEEIIRSATPKDLEDYYRTWYRPERMSLILVGDSELEPLRPLIEKWFGQYRPQAAAQPPAGPEFKPFETPRALIVTDAEFASSEVGAVGLHPGRPPVTTVEGKRTALVEQLACWAVGRRLSERAKKGQAAYQSARVNVDQFFHEAMIADGSATGKPEEWASTLEELSAELTRAREYAFTDREFGLARRELSSQAERAVRTEPTREAEAIMFEIARAINDGEPIMSAQQDLDVLSRLLPTIQASELGAAVAQHFAPDTLAWVLQMPRKDDVKVPSEDELLAAARAALAKKPEPPVEVELPKDLLEAEPAPGKVVESRLDEDLGITSAWFENGVRLHHRYMDYKKDTVLVSISLAGGQIEETAENAGITAVATLAINQAATHRLASTEITDIMTGKNIQVAAAPGDDALIVQITGSPYDLETGLRLAHVLLTDAKLEDSAFDTWKQRLLQRLEMAQSFPEFKAFEALRVLIGGGDPRLLLPTRERIERQSVPTAQAWLERLCREAPIEVAIVGDIKLDEARALAEKYLGSLPSRPRGAAPLDPLRKLTRQPGPFEKHVDVTTVTPKGMVFFGFLGCDAREVDDARLLQIAANVLDSRLIKRIREVLSLVYSIQVMNEPALAYVDSGQFLTGAPCDPDKVAEVIKEAQVIFEAFAAGGPTAEELDNAKKQIANNLDTDMKEPSYWWGILQSLDLHGVNLGRIKTIRADFEGYTAEQVRDVFRKYYTPARTIRVTAVPSAGQSGSEPPPSGPSRTP